MELRDKLQCKDMKWFLDNVMMDSVFGIKDYFYLGYV